MLLVKADLLEKVAESDEQKGTDASPALEEGLGYLRKRTLFVSLLKSTFFVF